MSYINQNVAFAPAGGIQELSFDEIEEVGGAWVANAVGGALGAFGGAATGYVSSGGSLAGAVAGAAAGGVAGALSPISGANSAARAITIHAARLGVGGLAGGGMRLSLEEQKAVKKN